MSSPTIPREHASWEVRAMINPIRRHAHGKLTPRERRRVAWFTVGLLALVAALSAALFWSLR